MNSTVLVTVARNSAVLAFIALPLFFCLAWIQELVSRTHRATDVLYAVETGGFYYVASLVPVIVGGAIHQLIWLSLPGGWPARRRRIAGVLLTPVIPFVVILWGVRAWFLGNLIVPLALALLVYALLIRRRMPSEAMG